MFAFQQVEPGNLLWPLEAGAGSQVAENARVGPPGGRLLAGFDRQLRAVLLSPFVSEHLKMFVAGEDHERLERLGALADDGRLRPSIGATYALGDAPRAMQDLAAGRARGKLVVTTA